ncbi:MAG: TetR/AcrR family transcriptional regulator [Thermodesulfobacteriota bacterium]
MPGEKLTKRKLQGRETRQKLFETSLALFNERGYENVTIDDICERIGVSKGAFYTHFKSKDQVIVENFMYLDASYDEVLADSKKAKSVFDKMYAFQLYAMRKLEEIGWKAVKLVYHVETGAGKNKSFLTSKSFSLYKIILSLVKEGQKSGDIRKDQSADTITETLVQLYRGVIFDWCLNNGAYSLVEAANSKALFVFEGIRTR